MVGPLDHLKFFFYNIGLDPFTINEMTLNTFQTFFGSFEIITKFNFCGLKSSSVKFVVQSSSHDIDQTYSPNPGASRKIHAT